MASPLSKIHARVEEIWDQALETVPLAEVQAQEAAAVAEVYTFSAYPDIRVMQIHD